MVIIVLERAKMLIVKLLVSNRVKLMRALVLVLLLVRVLLVLWRVRLTVLILAMTHVVHHVILMGV